MGIETRLEPIALEPDRELNRLLACAGDDGAVVSFVGKTRGADRDGHSVSGLHLDHYPGMTEASLERIAAETARRFAVSHVVAVHRCGFVPAGAPIVFAAAASAHRRDAFLAADYLMDRLKTDAVFWKREEGVAGSRWIEPSDRDRTDRQRWDQPCQE
jgi:molybdopterin synthase catalytic subunit